MFFGILTIATFMGNNHKLPSGRLISSSGNGPKLLLTTGLLGTMPPFLYRDLRNILDENFFVVTYNDFKPVNKDSIKELYDYFNNEKFGLLTHSSFSPEILDKAYLNYAVLCDPIVIPDFRRGKLMGRRMNAEIPIVSIKAEYLYNSNKQLPHYQDPEIIGDIKEIIYSGVGHADLLNNLWADLAKFSSLWLGTDSKLKRDEYRKFIAEECIDLEPFCKS